MTLEKAREKLEKYGQQHVLRYFEELTEREKESLLLQIEETDFDIISSCRGSKDRESRGVFAPLSVMQLEEIRNRKEEFTNIGCQAIKDGQIGAILLAGGMGTRLGSDDPKGVYNIGITKDVFIFQCIIENLLDVVKMTGAVVPLFIMTSDKNHKATTEFLAEHQYFGYDKEYVFFLQQEMAEYYQKLRQMADENQTYKDAESVPEHDVLRIKKIYRDIAKKLHPDISPP